MSDTTAREPINSTWGLLGVLGERDVGPVVLGYEFSYGLLKLSLKNPDGRVTATLSWRKLN